MTGIPPNDIQNRIKELVDSRVDQQAEEQIFEASRIISEIDEIDSRAAFEKISYRLNENRTGNRVLYWSMRIAAGLFVPLLLASTWLAYRQFTQPEVHAAFAMQEITSPAGMRSQVVLPDGSKVWLNAESTLKFPVPFPKDIRNIDLKGEAFFEVVKNQNKPFVVQSGNVQVKVLGTRFDCKAFDEDKTIEVILEEGSVALNSNITATGAESVLKPGDRAVIEKETGKTQISNEEVQKYIAWHTGKLVFDNTSMEEVASMIERWYGVEVVIQDPEILKNRFTTTFDNESIFHVIELLGLSSPIQLKYIPASIGKEKQAQTKARIIISKKQA
jgi:ferric-dicitrate binding protein FerR (iron transport regulator)